MKNTKHNKRIVRHRRVRAKISGSADVPRIAVFRSNKFIHAQVIDDKKRVTLFSANDRKDSKGKKTERATKIGEELAKKVKDSGLNNVVFDRGGYSYHGRVKALAEGLRKGGMEF